MSENPMESDVRDPYTLDWTQETDYNVIAGVDAGFQPAIDELERRNRKLEEEDE